MQNLKDLIKDAGFALTEEEEQKQDEELVLKHRGRSVVERPKEEFTLKSISEEEFVRKKVQADPTADLKEIPIGLTDAEELYGIANKGGFLIVCTNTLQLWYAPTKECLDANFIYRKDLDIYPDIDDVHILIEAYQRIGADKWNSGLITKKKCYIMDNPGNESYEVYYESDYPSIKYGKATPNGMFINVYDNRFHRDMAIMELDKIYSEASKRRAADMTKQELKNNEAIIISDGCWMKESCSSAFWYLDKTRILSLKASEVPSEPDQAVLISEVNAATWALKMCMMNYKKDITYYYDNTSILNVFRNRKTEYIQEIKDYKELLENMDADGYKIKFVELHPKTGEDRDEQNRALMYFHNDCDRQCREISDVFKKDYRMYAAGDNRDGKTYQQVKQEFKPNGKPGQGGKPYKPNNNFNPRKH